VVQYQICVWCSLNWFICDEYVCVHRDTLVRSLVFGNYTIVYVIVIVVL